MWRMYFQWVWIALSNPNLACRPSGDYNDRAGGGIQCRQLISSLQHFSFCSRGTWIFQVDASPYLSRCSRTPLWGAINSTIPHSLKAFDDTAVNGCHHVRNSHWCFSQNYERRTFLPNPKMWFRGLPSLHDLCEGRVDAKVTCDPLNFALLTLTCLWRCCRWDPRQRLSRTFSDQMIILFNNEFLFSQYHILISPILNWFNEASHAI